MQKFLIIALALVILYSIFSFIRFRALIAKGVAQVATTKPFERRIPEATQRILVVGDSSAVGVGATSSSTGTTAGLIAADYPNAEVVNIGISGLRAEGLRKLLEEKAETLGTFDIMLIQIGGNDITHFTPLSEVERDVRAILAIAKKLAPKVILLHTGNLGRSPIFPWPISWAISWETRRVRALYKEIVLNDPVVRYIDLYGARVDDEFHTDIKKYYGIDEFHLADAGWGVWYREIKKVINTMN